MSAAACPTCGTPRAPGAEFCGTCGTRFEAAPAAAPFAPAPTVAQAAGPAPVAAGAPVREVNVDWDDLKRRAKEIWFPLVLLGVMGYFDYLAHGQIVTVVLGGGVALGVILFRKEIGARLNLGGVFSGLPQWVRPVLVAVPAMLWFVIRGQGTSGAGFVVMLVTLGIAAVIGAFGPAIDQRLAGFYAARNRVLPRPLRMVLAIVGPILVGFWVVHGTLAGLPVLFFGTTSSPAYATDRVGLFLLSTILSAGIAFLLLREARRDAV